MVFNVHFVNEFFPYSNMCRLKTSLNKQVRLHVLLMFYPWVQEGLVFQLDLVVQQNQEALEIQQALEVLQLLVQEKVEEVRMTCEVQGVVQFHVS